MPGRADSALPRSRRRGLAFADNLAYFRFDDLFDPLMVNNLAHSPLARKRDVGCGTRPELVADANGRFSPN